MEEFSEKYLIVLTRRLSKKR